MKEIFINADGVLIEADTSSRGQCPKCGGWCYGYDSHSMRVQCNDSLCGLEGDRVLRPDVYDLAKILYNLQGPKP